jgi:probable rRNA maturation factor
VDDVEMARLHLAFMGEAGPTDVMAFPAEDHGAASSTWSGPAFLEEDDSVDDDDVDDDVDEASDDVDDDGASARVSGVAGGAALGDIVIDWQQVQRQARDASLRAQIDEATVLLVHGLCHLLGHDHRTRAQGRRMHRAERKLLRGLRVPDVPRPYAADAAARPQAARPPERSMSPHSARGTPP